MKEKAPIGSTRCSIDFLLLFLLLRLLRLLVRLFVLLPSYCSSFVSFASSDVRERDTQCKND